MNKTQSLFIFICVFTSQMSMALDRDSTTQFKSDQKHLRLMLGSTSGPVLIENESSLYSNQNEKFHASSIHFGIESPHKKLYISIRSGVLVYNPRIKGRLETSGGRSYSTGYDFVYEERTHELWYSCRLNYRIGRSKSRSSFSLAAGWGQQQYLKHHEKANTKISYDRTHGWFAGPPPAYTAHYVDRTTRDTSQFLSTTNPDRKNRKSFVEINVTYHIKIHRKIALSAELSSRLFGSEPNSFLSALTMRRYRYVGFNFTYIIRRN